MCDGKRKLQRFSALTGKAAAATAAVAVVGGLFSYTPASAGSFTAVRLVVGTPLTDSYGRYWKSETGAIGGQLARTTHDITGTVNDGLYQRERWGLSGYTIPVGSAGTYRVRMYQTEIYHNAAGKRLFDVTAEGRTRLSNVDIFARAGGKFRATIVRFDVVVNDGTLNVGFVHKVDFARVSSLQVTRLSTTSTATPTVSPTATPTVSPTATPTATTPVVTARDHTLQPFSRTSIWNLPIGTGATFESAGDPLTANLVHTGGAWANEGTYSHPISRARTSDPLAYMKDTSDASRSASYRIPADAPIAAGTDAHMHVISPDGRSIDEAWAVSRQSSTAYTTGRHHTVDLFGSGMGPRNGTRAYGGSAVGGLVRAWEVDPTHPRYTGEIRHPIAMALRNDQLLHTGGGVGYRADGYMLQSGYVWPATEQDWDSPWSYSGKVPMGAYFAIPGNVDLNGLGLTPQGLMLARAYQNYGGYVTDRSGETVLAFVEPSPAGSAFTHSLLGPSWTASDLKKIKAQLRRVTNNTAATPNGAPLEAPRRAPMLPN